MGEMELALLATTIGLSFAGALFREEVWDLVGFIGFLIGGVFYLTGSGVSWVYRKMTPEPTLDEMVQATIEEMDREKEGEAKGAAESEWDTYLHSHHANMRGLQERIDMLRREREACLAEIETLEHVVDNTSADRDQLVEENKRLREEKQRLRERLTDQAIQQAADQLGRRSLVNGKPPSEVLRVGGWDIPIPDHTDHPRVNRQNVARVLRQVWRDNLMEVSEWREDTFQDGSGMVTFLAKIRREPPDPLDW